MLLPATIPGMSDSCCVLCCPVLSPRMLLAVVARPTYGRCRGGHRQSVGMGTDIGGRVISAADAARLLCMSRKTFYNSYKAMGLPVVRRGGSVRFGERAVLAVPGHASDSAGACPERPLIAQLASRPIRRDGFQDLLMALVVNSVAPQQRPDVAQWRVVSPLLRHRERLPYADLALA